MIIPTFSQFQPTLITNTTTTTTNTVSSTKCNLVSLVTERLKQHNAIFRNITELCLDEIPFVDMTQQVAKLIQKCERVKHLSMSQCRLKKLSAFPKLNSLQFLDLSNNALTQDCYEQLLNFQNLIGINLDNNSFYNISKLTAFLSKMKNLKQISLRNNKFEDQKTLFPSFSSLEHQIAKQIFANSQSLEFVNGIDRNGCDRVSDNESLESSSSQQNLQMDNIPEQEQEEYNNDDEQSDPQHKNKNVPKQISSLAGLSLSKSKNQQIQQNQKKKQVYMQKVQESQEYQHEQPQKSQSSKEMQQQSSHSDSVRFQSEGLEQPANVKDAKRPRQELEPQIQKKQSKKQDDISQQNDNSDNSDNRAPIKKVKFQ